MRKSLVIWLFEVSKNVYTRYFKKNHIPWNTTVPELKTYPITSFGYVLGDFLQKHHYELIPKVERHDAYHVLTQYGTTVEEEIGLQYLCMGNGKKSLYMYGAVLLGTLLLPEYCRFYYQSYLIGQQSNPFHDFDYEKLLSVNYDDLYEVIFTDEIHYTKTQLLLNLKQLSSLPNTFS